MNQRPIIVGIIVLVVLVAAGVFIAGQVNQTVPPTGTGGGAPPTTQGGAPDGVTVPPVVANRMVYFLTDDADLIAYQ